MRRSVFLLLIALTGCTGFIYHGNYCGPGYPRPTGSHEIIDDVDAICQVHDECYGKRGESQYACDVALVRGLLSLSLNPPCQNVAREIALYFGSLHPSDLKNPVLAAAVLSGKASIWPVTAGGVFQRGAFIMTDGRPTLLQPCCDRRTVPSPGSRCYPESPTPTQLRIMRALTTWHEVEGLYYEKWIPEKVIARARSIAAVPESERVIAVIRSPGDAFVFTRSGLFFGQLLGGPGFYTYPELARIPLSIVDEDTLELGSRRFRFVDWPPGALYGVLRDARNAAVQPDDASDRGIFADAMIAIPEGFEGEWRGEVTQAGVPPFAVVLQIPSIRSAYAGDAVGKIAYPGIGCGGSLTLIAASDGVLRVGEVIAYGKRKCVNGGTISLELTSANTASWSWTDGNARHAANGKLQR